MHVINEHDEHRGDKHRRTKFSFQNIILFVSYFRLFIDERRERVRMKRCLVRGENGGSYLARKQLGDVIFDFAKSLLSVCSLLCRIVVEEFSCKRRKNSRRSGR